MTKSFFTEETLSTISCWLSTSEPGNELWKTPQAEPFHAELACTAIPIVQDDLLVLHGARSSARFRYRDRRAAVDNKVRDNCNQHAFVRAWTRYCRSMEQDGRTRIAT